MVKERNAPELVARSRGGGVDDAERFTLLPRLASFETGLCFAPGSRWG